MRAAPALIPFLLLAGCLRDAPPAPAEFIDPLGDAAARYDLIGFNITQLSGSIALRAEFHNFQDGLPFLEVRLGTTGGEAFARVVPDPSIRTGLQARAEGGRVVDGEETDVQRACWFPSIPSNPRVNGTWYVVVELLHNQTGLVAGGSVTSAEVSSRDERGQMIDLVAGPMARRIEGGTNPYAPECPLDNERTRTIPE